ncbi:hypothetical protein F5884DRAFT_532601 [Xylogone sp. PMI_703]|nr:hypothetical protein F5884DRAFT_532601 [Xylogone sp. PMI_703]
MRNLWWGFQRRVRCSMFRSSDRARIVIRMPQFCRLLQASPCLLELRKICGGSTYIFCGFGSDSGFIVGPATSHYLLGLHSESVVPRVRFNGGMDLTQFDSLITVHETMLISKGAKICYVRNCSQNSPCRLPAIYLCSITTTKRRHQSNRNRLKNHRLPKDAR